MANKAKVMDSIKSFLLKMKALDAEIPEELAEDACSMVEEVKDALCEEEEVKDEEPEKEVEEKAEDACKDEAPTITEKEIEKKVEDAISKALLKAGLIKDSAMKSLDELEEKMEKAEDEMNEEEVTVDPEKMNDSAKRELLREIKPVIASIKDSVQRKQMADAFAKALNMNTADNGQYAQIYEIAKSNAKDENSAKKSQDSDYDFGMAIAKKYNPHYKEVE